MENEETLMKNALEEIRKLIEIMRRLRAPGGCPWDRKQTFDSLCPHIVEEAYETVDAIRHRAEEGGMEHVVEECGDLLLQVIFLGTVAEEEGSFTIGDIAHGITGKLIRRHPHIFAPGNNSSAGTAGEALANWEKVKQQERASGKKDTSVLSGVPSSLPPMLKAYRIQEKAAGVGFDWKKGDERPVFDKIREEIAEVEEAYTEKDKKELAGEIGDLLFAIIKLSRRCGIDPEAALEMTNTKFDSRFRFVEKKVEESGGKWESFSLSDLENFWKQAKTASLCYSMFRHSDK